jgi:hypothetical protein
MERYCDVGGRDSEASVYFHLPLVSLGFVYNLLFVINQAGVNFPSICDIEVTVPQVNLLPEYFERFGTAVTQHPSSDTGLAVVNCCP